MFREDGVYKRAVSPLGGADYDLLKSSGLYSTLAERGALVRHQEEPAPDGLYKILVPEQIRHVSYPYEWSFSQWKDAALLTLDIQEAALRHGMSLKDASAFNVQFVGPRAVFIDTLSFEQNRPGPWNAYGQFCGHFLAPLALMAHVSVGLAQHFRACLDGWPLELASKLLPSSTWLRMGLLLHVHLHARSQAKYQGTSARNVASRQRGPSPDRKQVLVESLRSAVESLHLPKVKTEWIDYYEDATHYSTEAQERKREVVERVAEDLAPALVYDLGGNVGTFSRLFTSRGIDCVCYDIDPLCVHENHLRAKREGDRHMLPLLLDLTNPSPSIGFGLEERAGVIGRSQPDLVMALALIHHLRFSGNIPLVQVARFLARLGPALLIEWVPKDDPMAQRLTGNRPDIFQDYSWEGFQAAFAGEFTLESTVDIPGTGRRLCLLRVRS